MPVGFFLPLFLNLLNMSQTIYIKTKKILADAHTPVNTFLKMRDLFAGCLLLESSDYYSNEKNYSFICCDPLTGIEVRAGKIRLFREGRYHEGPIPANKQEISSIVRSYLSSYMFEMPDNETIRGRFFGHFNYDAVTYFDTISSVRFPVQEDVADIRLFAYRHVIVFDHYHHTVYLTEHSPDSNFNDSFGRIEAALRAHYSDHFYFRTEGEEQSDCTDHDYLEMVRKGIHHCRIGDVFQIVLSRLFHTRFKGDEFQVYRALRMVNPSPYLFFFDYGDYRIFGSSPEAQLKISDGKAVIHPIAGTVRRSGDTVIDLAALKFLQADSKENAEHVMLVDLARNDLSRSFDKVEITYLKNIQEFSHVYHMVSEVTGDEMQHNDVMKALSETFPAGTLSGAPKYKAIELIDSIEHSRRTFYGGCAGFIDGQGMTNQAILIRSFLSIGHTLYYRAGAGVTVHSDPMSELNEVNHKLRALRKAIELAGAAT